MQKLTVALLCLRCSTHINSLNPHRYRNWLTEWLSNLSKVNKIVFGRTRVQTDSTVFAVNHYTLLLLITAYNYKPCLPIVLYDSSIIGDKRSTGDVSHNFRTSKDYVRVVIAYTWRATCWLIKHFKSIILPEISVHTYW